MCKTLLIVAIALGPSFLLMAWALWSGCTRPEPIPEDIDDFLERQDTWGAR